MGLIVNATQCESVNAIRQLTDNAARENAGPARLFRAISALFADNLLEEIVAFVIHQDKGREIFYFNFSR